MSTPTPQRTTHTPTGLTAFAWSLVAVPPLYALYQPVQTASSLFG